MSWTKEDRVEAGVSGLEARGRLEGAEVAICFIG